jgi:hypothetical protein
MVKEPLIKSIMNRVADKNGILAATRYRETAACGSGEGASSPHQRFAYREPMSTARRATPVAAATRYCAAADCGSSRWQPPPAPDAYAHRVGGAAPSEGNHHSRRRLSCNALATRYCAAADCGSEGGQAIPHQVLCTTVSGLQPRKAGCAAMRDLIRGSLAIPV